MAEGDVGVIERRAEEALAGVPDWLWDGESLPVPVERIADSHFSLLVRDMPDLTTAPGCPQLAEGQGLSGLLLPVDGEIWVNADEAEKWPGRRRFTICHELGHWVMPRDGEHSVFCRAHDVQEDEPGDAIPDIEEEASVFAAALLMPARLMRREYERDSEVFSRGERFRACTAAMGRRLHAVI